MRIDWKRLCIDAAVLFLLTFVGGFLVGFLAGLNAQQINLPLLGLSNLILATVGFAISSYRIREGRWVHLALLAGIFWISGLVNAVIGFTDFSGWLMSAVPTLVFMALGGGIGWAMAKNRSSIV